MGVKFSGGVRAVKGIGRMLGLTAFLLAPAALVVALLYLLINVRNGADAAVAGFASLLPVGYAFAADMVASVNTLRGFSHTQ